MDSSLHKKQKMNEEKDLTGLEDAADVEPVKIVSFQLSTRNIIHNNEVAFKGFEVECKYFSPCSGSVRRRCNLALQHIQGNDGEARKTKNIKFKSKSR